MSAQAPATNNVAPSAVQANQVQSQEVEAPQNAQTQQPQASTSNNSQVTAAPTESKSIRRFISKCECSSKTNCST